MPNKRTANQHDSVERLKDVFHLDDVNGKLINYLPDHFFINSKTFIAKPQKS